MIYALVGHVKYVHRFLLCEAFFYTKTHGNIDGSEIEECHSTVLNIFYPQLHVSFSQSIVTKRV